MANITFVGDIMCSPRMTEMLYNDYSPIFSHSKKLSECDYLVGNLETPIAGEKLKYTHDRYCFNSPENFLRSCIIIEALSMARFVSLTAFFSAFAIRSGKTLANAML